jgi:vacuolar-type H+-ATPase subunit H
MAIDGNNRKRGIYAARDFIRKGEEAEYTDTVLALMEQLQPEGILEETFATEIMGATWRLRRCRLIEEAFGCIDDLDFDPMIDERTEKQQKTVDRARAQAHLILRRSLAELKKLQAGRQRQTKPDPKPKEDSSNAMSAPPINPMSNPMSNHMSSDMTMDEFEAMLGLSDAQLNSFCVPPVIDKAA